MPNSNQKAKPINNDYFPSLGCTSAFFTPHKDANHLNAQDVIHSLVGSAKDISTVTFNCFENGKELTINGEIVANLIFEIQTKLEMIEKILPLAFEWEKSNKGGAK